MKIDELIEKYFEGETSPNEEKLLRELLEHDKSGKYEEIKVLLNGFDGLHRVSTNSINLPLKNKVEKAKIIFSNKKIFNIKLSYYLVAAVLIIVSMFAITISMNTEQGVVITDNNVKENTDFTKKEIGNAFALASDKADKAFENTEVIDDVTKKMGVLNKLNLINKYSNKHR